MKAGPREMLLVWGLVVLFCVAVLAAVVWGIVWVSS